MWVAEWCRDETYKTGAISESEAKAFGEPQYGRGWKVGFRNTECDHFIPLKYGRRQDAQAAADHLNKILPAETLEECAEQIISFGLDNLRKEMTGCLSW